MFQFHHAATDGVGAIQFIGDLLACYAQFTSASAEQVPQLVPLERDRLRQRGQLWEPGHRPAGLLRRLARSICILAPVTPTDVATRRKKTPQLAAPTEYVDPFVTRILNPAQVLAIKAAATARGTTANDLYTLAMFQALERWNRSCGRTTSREAFRIGLPTTLRTPRHEDSPAANILSYMFLTQPGTALNDPQQMLRYISETSRSILISGDSGLTPWAMGGMRSIPGLFKLTSSIPLRFATAMFANVGDVRKQFHSRFQLDRGRCVAGNVVLEHLLGAAPIRPRTWLGVSLGTYARQLYINVNCDPRRYSAEDSNQLADLFVSSILELTQPDSSSDQAATLQYQSSGQDL